MSVASARSKQPSTPSPDQLEFVWGAQAACVHFPASRPQSLTNGSTKQFIAKTFSKGAEHSTPGRVRSPENRSRDAGLELRAREVLRSFEFNERLRVEWNARLKSCAGRADFRARLISLNPRLHDYPDEIEGTFLHELAHILAQLRAGRRRISPHGSEWRQACRDLGIANEKRCHNLPFAITERIRHFLYKCPNCAEIFPRVRKIRRVVACLACCRAYNGGQFDARFRLRLVL